MPFSQKPGTIIECSEREAHALVTRKQGVLWDAKKDSELPKKNVDSFLKATGKKLADESKAQAEKLAKAEKQRLAKIAEESSANESLKADAAGDDGTGSESDSAGDSERPKPGN